MIPDRLSRAYRAARADGLPARIALAVARTGLAAVDAGITSPREMTLPMIFDGEPYTITIESDDYPWSAFDDDVHGEVIDRYPHRDYIGGGYGHDRANGETVLAIDRATAYRVDAAAASVTDLAGWRHRAGMARGPAYESARAELVGQGRRMAKIADGRDCPEVYAVTVTDAEGRSESLYGIEVRADTPGQSLAGSGYLYEVAQELADLLADARRERREALAAAIPRLGDLWLFAGESA